MPALAIVYAVTIALTLLLLFVFFAFPTHATRFTANIAVAELVILALQTVLLALVFLYT